MTTRRQFIATGTALGAAAGLGLSTTSLLASSDSKAEKSLDILFLGGTGFLGPHTVNYALSRGHKVTLFNRGRSREQLFPELETIKGNRDPNIDAGLSGLEGRKWDCVIDTSGYVPRIVGASAELLKDAVEKALANMRELAEMAGKSNTEAFDTIHKRFTESLDEVKTEVLKLKK